MKVFITGCTGYIGSSVAQTFRRAGHEVWGLARNDKKAAELRRNEVHVIIGDVNKPDTYRGLAHQCDVLIHAASDMGQGVTGPDRTVIDTFLNLGGRGMDRRTFLYTSGVWVLGDSGDGMFDEGSPPNPARTVGWRPAHEQIVLESGAVRGIVIRPGCVYGKQGGLTGHWFQNAQLGKPQVWGDGRNRWAMVHVDDLARGYLLAAESRFSREIFHLTDRSRFTVMEMAEAAARVVGCKTSVRPVPPNDDLSAALALNQHVDSSKAVRLLGWQPLHGGFLDQVDRYYASWKAWNEIRG